MYIELICAKDPSRFKAAVNIDRMQKLPKLINKIFI